jgi:hypothetical protein
LTTSKKINTVKYRYDTFPIARTSKPAEQLKTMHCLATAFARSFTVSVLPVPAGPVGAAPRFKANADVRDRKARSVSGVCISRVVFPRYLNIVMLFKTYLIMIAINILVAIIKRSLNHADNAFVIFPVVPHLPLPFKR